MQGQSTQLAQSVNPMILTFDRRSWIDPNRNGIAEFSELGPTTGFRGGVSTRIDRISSGPTIGNSRLASIRSCPAASVSRPRTIGASLATRPAHATWQCPRRNTRRSQSRIHSMALRSPSTTSHPRRRACRTICCRIRRFSITRTTGSSFVRMPGSETEISFEAESRSAARKRRWRAI